MIVVTSRHLDGSRRCCCCSCGVGCGDGSVGCGCDGGGCCSGNVLMSW